MAQATDDPTDLAHGLLQQPVAAQLPEILTEAKSRRERAWGLGV